jgi:CheY-like chemotaxis protein
MTDKKKILVIDDDEVHILTAESFLKDDYEVFSVKSGKEALEHLIKGNIPNLLLLDILMPNMDGWETFNRIKAISCLEDVPIIFLTSVSEIAEEKRAFEIGAKDYIKKPYVKNELLDRIKIVMEED